MFAYCLCNKPFPTEPFLQPRHFFFLLDVSSLNSQTFLKAVDIFSFSFTDFSVYLAFLIPFEGDRLHTANTRLFYFSASNTIKDFSNPAIIDSFIPRESQVCFAPSLLDSLLCSARTCFFPLFS